MLNSKNAILERKNYRNLSSNTVRLTSLFDNSIPPSVLVLYKTMIVSLNWDNMPYMGLPKEKRSSKNRINHSFPIDIGATDCR